MWFVATLVVAFVLAVPVHQAPYRVKEPSSLPALLQEHVRLGFDIEVEDFGGSTHKLAVEGAQTVADVKNLLRVKTERVGAVRLFHKGVHLLDDRTLASYDIKEGSKLNEGTPLEILSGRGATIYEETRWWNKELTLSDTFSRGFFPGATTDRTVEEERHHICPFETLGLWWDKMIKEEHLPSCAAAFLDAMEANIDELEGLKDADKTKSAVKLSVALLKVNTQANSGDFAQFVGYFAYAPGNIFFGPGSIKYPKENAPNDYNKAKARSDDPGKKFEVHACGIDATRYASALTTSTEIQAYIRDGRLATCQRAAAAYAELYAVTGIKAMKAADWALADDRAVKKGPKGRYHLVPAVDC